MKILFSDEVREKMKSRYLSNPDYNFEKVNRASLACGPMVKWAIAQVSLMNMKNCTHRTNKSVKEKIS